MESSRWFFYNAMQFKESDLQEEADFYLGDSQTEPEPEVETTQEVEQPAVESEPMKTDQPVAV